MLYRVLKTAAHFVILLGLLLMLFGLGVSVRRASPELLALYTALAAPPGQLAVAPAQPGLPSTAGQAGLANRVVQPAQAQAADAAAWEEFDPAIFDQEQEGFLPFTVEAGSGEAPPLVPLTGAPDAAAPPPAASERPAAGEPTPAPEVRVVVVPPVVRAPTRIEIPAIQLDAPIVAVFAEPVRQAGHLYEQWQAPAQFAAGWHESSAWLGEPGNTVLNGHHNVYGMVFERLHELSERDEIIVYGEDQMYVYRVHQVLILEERGLSPQQRAENARWIMPSGDERLTLITCWPPESNTHRLIVVAARYR